MNNIVETYLMFKANNILDLIDVLAKEKRIISKIPRTLNKLIYKYYDLFVLSSEEIDYEWLVEKTGLRDNKERLILFYLLIEFDFASKTEYKDLNYYELYNFIVNSIIFFRLLDDAKGDTFNDKILDVINDERIIVESEYILLVENCSETLEKIYKSYIKLLKKFDDEFNFPMYDVKFSKVKNSENLYFNKFKYNNSELNNELKRDIQFINDEYTLKLFFVNLNLSSLRLYKESNKELFFVVPDEVITKKSNYILFLNFIKLRFLKKRINFVVNISLCENYLERINNLISNNVNISLYEDKDGIINDYVEFGNYLFINNKNIDNKIKTLNHQNVIVVNPNNEDINEHLDIMYIT